MIEHPVLSSCSWRSVLRALTFISELRSINSSTCEFGCAQSKFKKFLYVFIGTKYFRSSSSWTCSPVRWPVTILYSCIIRLAAFATRLRKILTRSRLIKSPLLAIKVLCSSREYSLTKISCVNKSNQWNALRSNQESAVSPAWTNQIQMKNRWNKWSKGLIVAGNSISYLDLFGVIII